jgi:hypothetical protein
MPGIFALREQLQQQYQHAPNKASVDHSMSLVDTKPSLNVLVAEARLCVLPLQAAAVPRHVCAAAAATGACHPGQPLLALLPAAGPGQPQQSGAAAAVSMGHACSRPGRQAGPAWRQRGPSGRGCQGSSRATCRQGPHSRRPCSSRQQQAAAAQHLPAPCFPTCCLRLCTDLLASARPGVRLLWHRHGGACGQTRAAGQGHAWDGCGWRQPTARPCLGWLWVASTARCTARTGGCRR